MLLKIKYHTAAVIKKMVYHLLYGRQLSFGRGTTFRSGFHLMIEKPGCVQIGDHCFFNHGCSINCIHKIQIGENTIFGEGVRIYDHNHRFSDPSKEIREQGYATSTVQIGSHCWIGSNVVLLRKAKIGDHCVIGAGCVINEEIPADSLVVPATRCLRIELITKNRGDTNAQIVRDNGSL